jgi:hypothetical protein
MSTLLKLEEAGIFLFSLWLFWLTGYPWWLFALLFLAPDLSMLGYTINTRIGAITYNIIHHRGLAIIIYLIGIFTHIRELQLAGIILLAHLSFDRILGYGLKYSDNFKHTHLGIIGEKGER